MATSPLRASTVHVMEAVEPTWGGWEDQKGQQRSQNGCQHQGGGTGTVKLMRLPGENGKDCPQKERNSLLKRKAQHMGTRFSGICHNRAQKHQTNFQPIKLCEEKNV